MPLRDHLHRILGQIAHLFLHPLEHGNEHAPLALCIVEDSINFF